jgi:large subunit ribosomal protein L4
MPKFKVYNMAGQVTGEVELSEAIFGIQPNEAALHASVKNHLANLRQGTQSALTRAEVSGGGMKPYRQKGTGRARQGSTRAVQWTHGGIAFAPKPRDYSYTINKKLKKLALKSALSQKAIENAIIVVDGIDMDGIKTKEFKGFLSAVGVSGKALVVTPEVRDTVIKSARNIPGVQTTIATILSAYDVLNATTFVVDKAALTTIEEVYA